MSLGKLQKKMQNKNLGFRLGEQTNSTLCAHHRLRGWFDSFNEFITGE